MNNATYLFCQINSCTGAFVTNMVYWNGVDTTIFFPPLIYCNTINEPYTLCVNAYVTDTNSINQNNYVIYLIKSVNTANGDSLYLADTDTIGTNAFACFENVTGTSYAKAMMLPGSSDYGNYLPTYHFQSLFWNTATAMNSNSMQYQNIHMQGGNYTGGPGFIGGYVLQGANRMDEAVGTDAVGDPVVDADVILMNSQNMGVKHVKTDVNGYYQFSALAYDTYKICVDMLNKPCIAPLYVNISPNQESVSNTQFIVGATNIFGSFTGIKKEENEPLLYKMASNPFSQNIRLLGTSTNNYLVTVKLLDASGRLVLLHQETATQNITLPTESINSGFYIIKIECNQHTQYIPCIKM
jgi:hypothetical protein